MKHVKFIETSAKSFLCLRLDSLMLSSAMFLGKLEGEGMQEALKHSGQVMESAALSKSSPMQ